MMCQHAQMHFRVGVPGEAAISNLALLLCLRNGLEHAVWDENGVRLSIGQNLVHLPEVQMIGLQSPQGILQHGQRLFLGFLSLVVSANFGHQEDPVTLPLQRDPHPFFSAPAGILPRIVKKGDTHIDRGMGNAGGHLDGFRLGPRGPAEPKRRHHLSMAAELALRNRPDGGGVRGENGRSSTSKDHACAGGAECLQEGPTMLLLELFWHSKATIVREAHPAQEWSLFPPVLGFRVATPSQAHGLSMACRWLVDGLWVARGGLARPPPSAFGLLPSSVRPAGVCLEAVRDSRDNTADPTAHGSTKGVER